MCVEGRFRSEERLCYTLLKCKHLIGKYSDLPALLNVKLWPVSRSGDVSSKTRFQKAPINSLLENVCVCEGGMVLCVSQLFVHRAEAGRDK